MTNKPVKKKPAKSIEKVKRTKKVRRKYKQEEKGIPIYSGWILPWTLLSMRPDLNPDAFRVFFLILRVSQARRRGDGLIIPKKLIEAWGIKERTYRNSLNRLSDEGLIRVHRRRLKPPLIDLKCIAPADPANVFRTERPIETDVFHAYHAEIVSGHPPAPQYEYDG